MKIKQETFYKLVAVFYYCVLASTVICTGIVAFYPKLQSLFFIPFGFFLLELASGTIWSFYNDIDKKIDKKIDKIERTVSMKKFHEKEFEKLCEMHDEMLERGELDDIHGPYE